MHSANRVAKNTGFLYMRMAITVFISLYATRLILNALGANDFGIFNVVGGAITMLTFLNVAMASATQRFMSFAQGEGNVDKQKSIFNVSLILHFIIGFLVVLLLEGIGYFLFNGVLKIDPNRLSVAKMLYHFMMISTFFTIISVPYDAVINARENMLLVAIMGVFEALLKLGVAIYITYSTNDKLIIYGILMASISIILMVTQRIYCHLKYDEVEINLKKYFHKPLFREMTSFAGWSFLGSSSSMISNYGQGIVINMFFGTVVNAAQGIAMQVGGQVSAFAGTMLKALNPIISKSEGAGNRTLMLNAAMMGSKISFFLLMFFVVPVLIEMQFIFKLWLKEIPTYTIIFCQLYLIRHLIDQMFVTLSTTISAVGNIRIPQITFSLINIMPLIISFFLFKLGQPPYIIYIVFIIYSIIVAFLTIYFAKIYCELPVASFIRNVVLRCLVSLLLVFLFSSIPLVFMNEGIIRLIIVLFANLISFLILIWFIGLSANERLKLNQVIQSLFKTNQKQFAQQTL